MRTVNRVVALLCVQLLAITNLAPANAAEREQGVIVDEVPKTLVAGKVGELQRGDIVTAWTRGEDKGEIRSPLDVAVVETEQAPLGVVTLHGYRSGEPRVWSLRPNQWGFASRPVVAAVEAGDPRQLWHAAEAHARERRWKDADANYKAAFDSATTLSHSAAAHILRTWADSLATREQWEAAEDRFLKSLEQSRLSGAETLGAAATFSGLGIMERKRGNLERAATLHNEALALRRKLAPRSLEVAATLTNLGVLARTRGDLAGAEKLYVQALDIRREIAPGGLEVAATLNNLGIVARRRGNLSAAENLYSEALAIFDAVAPDSLNAGELANNLGNVVQDRGDLEHAEQYFAKALAVKERLAPGSSTVAYTLVNLGNASYYRGDLSQAERRFREALAIFQKATPNAIEVGQALFNLANILLERGELEAAEKHHIDALRIQEKLAPNSLDVAESLNSLGLLSLRSRKYKQALQLQQRSLELYEKIAPESLDAAAVLKSLGLVSKELGEIASAEQYHKRALDIEERLAPQSLNVADSYAYMAAVKEQLGDGAQAGELYRRAVAIYEQLSPDGANHATALYSLGRLARQQNDKITAARLFDRAVTTVERQSMRLGGPEEYRADYRARHSAYYRDYIEVLIEQGQAERAFSVLERSRARSFLAMLRERDRDLADYIPEEIEKARKRNEAEYDRTHRKLASESPVKNPDGFKQLVARLQELRGERTRLVEDIKRANPRLGTLRFPEPLDLDRTRALLDPGTVLLAYSVGPQDTTLFVVPAAGSNSGLTTLRLPVGEDELRRGVAAFRQLVQRVGDEAARPALDRRSRRLYDQLIKPAEPLLASARRVMLVPDGPLYVLPFASLRRPDQSYLVQWKPLHTVVSASVYFELRQTRNAPQRESGTVAAFGDPLSGGLQFSRREVATIRALYADTTRVYLGQDATEERAKSLGENVRYIHFATHGILDERLPLNSALVLSSPTNASTTRDNGLLQAWEIYEQVRWNADLVVLSACESALGREFGGEGLVGLTRALHYAGAQSVLGSLWKVEDRRTAGLMRRFYTHLRAGKTKDDALRRAQVDMITSQTAAHPFYWAAFVLNGDWR